uniref:Uncharacterized protein n=1 Tax=Anguilla anguilla TaxID=7936 RepID=A0A0E9R2T7_ANGAN
MGGGDPADLTHSWGLCCSALKQFTCPGKPPYICLLCPGSCLANQATSCVIYIPCEF